MKISACLATTLDGKIDMYNNRKWRFSSDRDMEKLRKLRGEHDVSLIGGSTFRQWPILRVAHLPDFNPVQCIVTSSENEIAGALKKFREKNPTFPLSVFHCGRDRAEGNTQFIPINKQSMTKNIIKYLDSFGNFKSLLLEGGGRLLGQFIDDGLLDDLHLTICPLLFGGIKDSSLLVCLKEYTKEKLPQFEVANIDITADKEIWMHLKLTYQANLPKT